MHLPVLEWDQCLTKPQAGSSGTGWIPSCMYMENCAGPLPTPGLSLRCVLQAASACQV